MIIRPARASDAVTVAELHAESWRRTYRGILSDEFLDGPVRQDRYELWKSRLSDVGGAAGLENQFVSLIEDEREIKGFVCVLLDADPEWGALVDNLHVTSDSQGRGLGRRLMAEAVGWVLEQRPQSRLHLWVFERNTAARQFYQRLGGVVTLSEVRPTPDGNQADELRYGWPDLSCLIGQPGT